MTMLAMWLGEKSVALATDSEMKTDDGVDKCVKKLHCIQPGKVMFGLGFSGDGAHGWFTECPCGCNGDHVKRWVEPSKGTSTNALERAVRKDLQTRKFPKGCILGLWVAGVNERGVLEAFILNETGYRVEDLSPGNVKFSVETDPPAYPAFWEQKRLLDRGQSQSSGAKALEIICKQIIDACNKINHPTIGIRLQYHKILQQNET